MYHLRLCKGLSYSGIVSASKREPDVFVEDKSTADQALATGFFTLIEGSDKAPAPKTQTGTITALDTATTAQLKEYAAANGIDIKGLTRKDDILARIREAEAAKVGAGTGEGGSNAPDGSGDEDDAANQFTGGSEDDDGGDDGSEDDNEGGGASE